MNDGSRLCTANRTDRLSRFFSPKILKDMTGPRRESRIAGRVPHKAPASTLHHKVSAVSCGLSRG